MQRIGIAGFLHETNTFSNTPTTLENFLNQSGFYPELLAGKEMLRFSEGKINIAASGFMADAETYGFTIVPLVWIGTEPSQPKGFDLAPDIIKQCETYAEDVGGSFKITNDFAEGFKGAHAVYPKAWAPFTLFQPPVGEYDFDKSQKIMYSFKSWKTTSELMDTCEKKAIYMHCLPADRGHEVNNDVMDKTEGLGWRSAIFDEAENRLHV